MPATIKSRSGETLFASDQTDDLLQLLYLAAEARASLKGADLRGADLRHAKLEHLDLPDADLTGARLGGAKLSHVNLSGARLTETDFSNALITDCLFAGAQAEEASFAGASLGHCHFAGANLYQSDFAHSFVADSNFIGAQLARFDPAGATFESCDLHGASFSHVVFKRTTINLSKLSTCHLRNSAFLGAHIALSDLGKSDLRQTRFEKCKLIKCSLARSVLSRARLHFNRLVDCDLLGVRARSASLMGNRYERASNLPPEMAAERASDQAVKLLSSIGSKALVGAVGVTAALNAPDEVTDLAQHHLIGKGAVGMLAMAGASLVLRQVAPVFYDQVVKRIERLMARSAPPVSSLVAKAPFAQASHKLRDLHFAFATGLSEGRILRLVESVNDKDDHPQHPMKRLHALFDRKCHVLIARDRDTLEEVQRLVADGKSRVVVLRLDDQGKPRQQGPALYEFGPGAAMKAVWFHRDKPDCAIAFDEHGKVAAQRSFSGRRRLVDSDEVLPTRILARGETSKRQALSWLLHDHKDGGRKDGKESGRHADEQAEIGLLLRQSAAWLTNATRFLDKEDRDLIQLGLGTASALTRVGATRDDRLSPHYYAKNIARTRDAINRMGGAMQGKGLYAYATFGRALTQKLEKAGRIFNLEVTHKSEAATSLKNAARSSADGPDRAPTSNAGRQSRELIREI